MSGDQLAGPLSNDLVRRGEREADDTRWQWMKQLRFLCVPPHQRVSQLHFQLQVLCKLEWQAPCTQLSCASHQQGALCFSFLIWIKEKANKRLSHGVA